MAFLSVALTSIHHSSDSFRRFDLSFRRSDFYPSLWRFFPLL
ncbi:hypothetical protein [Lysinibacillus sp. CTST325]